MTNVREAHKAYLSLQQVSGNLGAAVTVVEGQGGGQARNGDTEEGGLGNYATVGGHGLVDGLGEEFVEEEVLKVLVLTEGVGDVAQEGTAQNIEHCVPNTQRERKDLRADNASTPPHKSDFGVVQVPVVLTGSFPQLHETLGV